MTALERLYNAAVVPVVVLDVFDLLPVFESIHHLAAQAYIL